MAIFTTLLWKIFVASKSRYFVQYQGAEKSMYVYRKRVGFQNFHSTVEISERERLPFERGEGGSRMFPEYDWPVWTKQIARISPKQKRNLAENLKESERMEIKKNVNVSSKPKKRSMI